MLDKKFLMPLAFAGVLTLAAPGLVGCEEEGPAEQAGEKIDEAVEDSKEAVEDATD